MSSTVPVEVDDDLLALVDAQAAAGGRPRNAVIAAALRRGLGAGELTQMLTTGRRDATLSEDEAMTLAHAELDALRAERRGA